MSISITLKKTQVISSSSLKVQITVTAKLIIRFISGERKKIKIQQVIKEIEKN